MIIHWFSNLNPILQAFLATCFTWFLTALGASAVFFFKTIDRRILDGMLGMTAGVMIAASFWSLLAPALEMADGSGREACVYVNRKNTTAIRVYERVGFHGVSPWATALVVHARPR